LRSEGLARLSLGDPEGAATLLSAALERAPDDPAERAKVRLLLARSMNAAGRGRDAVDALAPVAAADVPLDLVDLVAFERARGLAVAADPGARDALAAFVATFPESDRAAEARLILARLAMDAHDQADAASQARKVLDGRAPRALKAEATLLAARAADETDRAAAMRRLFIEMPDTDAASATGVSEADLSNADLERRAQAFFDVMDYEEAQRIREGLWASGDRTPRLAHLLALSHLVHVRDDPRRALAMLDVAEKGRAVDATEALFLRARAHAKIEDYDAALALYRKALASGVKGERRVQALYYLGWLPYDRGEYAKALPRLDAFLKAVPKHDLRSYVLWAKGWSLYHLKRHREALKVFAAMEALGNCLVAGKAMYWGGMAWRALGDAGKAEASMRRVVATYPLTWYAVLGAKRLKEWRGTPLPEWITGPAAGIPRPAARWPFDALPEPLALSLRRVKDLADVGEIGRARDAWAPIARDVERVIPTADKARFVLTLHDAIEDYHGQYQRAEGELGRGMGALPAPATAPAWMVAYPEAHRSLASVVARRFEMPEHWIYAIMRQESRYRPAQVSHTAAMGLMQMIPKTAKVVGLALGVRFDVGTFFEPGRNLLFCSYYLAALLRDFRGQLVFASAAYNAGAPAIKRFLERHRGLPFDAMVEHIAYNEARNYCRKVAEHLIRYAYLHLPPPERAALYARLFPDAVDYDVGTDVEY
jgi:soluble lytic murein transglycosylase